MKNLKILALINCIITLVCAGLCFYSMAHKNEQVAKLKGENFRLEKEVERLQRQNDDWWQFYYERTSIYDGEYYE